MSVPVMALGGAAYEGTVSLRELAPRTMISLRGDLASAKMTKAVRDAAGLAVPDRLGATFGAGTAALWMSPDELLLISPRDEQEKVMAAAEKALAGSHHLVADVSDARAAFRLEGEGAHVREVLAKLSPADAHPEALPPGTVRRTRFAQVPAAFWMQDDNSAEVVAFRSVAAYVFGLLKTAAAAGPVGHFR